MVEYTAFNVITFLVGMLFLFNGYWLVRSGREDVAVFLMSGIVGLGLILVAVLPNVFSMISRIVGIESEERWVFVVSNLTLFVVVTYLFNRIGNLYGKISRLNEELSLVKAELARMEDDDE